MRKFSVVLLLSLVFCVQASAATVTWDGGGADENWSTAANWSGDSVPGSSDNVVFDSTSSKNCAIDADVSMGSLTINDSYDGVVSCGSSTITLTTGNFNGTYAKDEFDAGTGTLKFTGSANQSFLYEQSETFHNLENAKSGGELIFAACHITLNRLKAGAGTTTKLTKLLMTVSELDLQGTSGNPVTIRSEADGDATDMTAGSKQTIKYASFRYIGASSGQPIDAGDNCVDAGGNSNVRFNGVRWWDGGGADNNWTTAANWYNDEVPTAGNDVIFNSLSSKDCTIDSNVQVGSFLIQSGYAGTVYGGSATLEIMTGDYNDAGMRFSCDTGKIKFSGTAAQNFTFSYLHNIFHDVEIAGTDVTFAQGLTIATFTIHEGASIHPIFQKRITAAVLDWEGTAEKPIRFVPAKGPLFDPIIPWQLRHTGNQNTQTISHVRVAHCDAGSGTAINGTNDCIDLGGNANWTFDAADGVTIAASSATSPACVEGFVQGGASTAITASNGGADEEVTFAAERFWYHDLALTANATTTVTVKDNGTALKSQAVSWTPTDVTAGGEADIRKDDSLLLTAGPVGAAETLHIDKDYDGNTFDNEVSGDPGDDNVAVQFTAAGTYTVAARIDTGAIHTMTVNVLSANLGSHRLGLWLMYACPRTVTITPAACVGKAWAGPADEGYAILGERTYGGGEIKLSLTAYDINTSKGILCRMGDEFSPILGHKTADSFDLEWSTATAMPVLKTYGDGDQLLGGTIKMTPHYDDVTVKLYVFTGSALFENGTLTQLIDTGTMDANGQSDYYMFAPTSGNVCHRMSVEENE